MATQQMHLFDVNIPGEITFEESKTLTAGETPTVVDTGLLLFDAQCLQRSLYCSIYKKNSLKESWNIIASIYDIHHCKKTMQMLDA